MLVPPWAESSQPVGALKAASLAEGPYNKLTLTPNGHLVASRVLLCLSMIPGHIHVFRRKKNMFFEFDPFLFLVFSALLNHLRGSEELQKIGFPMPQRQAAVLLYADVFKIFRFST